MSTRDSQMCIVHMYRPSFDSATRRTGTTTGTVRFVLLDWAAPVLVLPPLFFENGGVPAHVMDDVALGTDTDIVVEVRI